VPVPPPDLRRHRTVSCGYSRLYELAACLVLLSVSSLIAVALMTMAAIAPARLPA
jgi:hypothetical protein